MRKKIRITTNVLAATINWAKTLVEFWAQRAPHLKFYFSINSFSSFTLIIFCWREFYYSIFLSFCPSTYVHPNPASYESANFFLIGPYCCAKFSCFFAKFPLFSLFYREPLHYFFRKTDWSKISPKKRNFSHFSRNDWLFRWKPYLETDKKFKIQKVFISVRFSIVSYKQKMRNWKKNCLKKQKLRYLEFIQFCNFNTLLNLPWIWFKYY